MKSLHFPVKGVGGLSLIFSEVVIVIMFAMVSAIVFLCRYRLSWCQSFGPWCRGIKYCQVKVSRYRFVRVSWCQGIGVRCKDMGAFIGESTLLLDFETFKAKHLTV
jgi:hypothetical protein